jgi:tetratricopeptide (TPR) repeat protein
MAKKKKPKHIRQVTPVDLINGARGLLDRGEFDEAIQDLQMAERELRPRSTPDGKKITIPPHLVAAQATLPPLMARAFVLRARHAASPAQKLSDFEEAIKRAPEEIRLQVAHGACRLLLGENDAAFAEFQKADESRPDDPLVTRGFALGLLSRGRASEAAALLERFPNEQRDEAWRRLRAAGELGSNGDAQFAAGDSLSRTLLGGLSSLARGDAERAGQQFAELPALDRNPSRAEAARIATQLFYGGALNFEARRYAAALGDWRESLRLAAVHGFHLPWRDRLPVYLHRIASEVRQEDLPMAIECWREAIKLSPGDAVAQANLALTKRTQARQAWREGRYADAASLWQEASQASPGDDRLLKNLALACEKLDRKEDAVKHWRALARLWRGQSKSRAEDDAFKARLAQLEQHVVNLMLETGASAQDIANELDAAIKLDPDNPDLLLRTAEILLEIDKPHQALKHLEAVEKLRGPSADLFMRRGTAHEMMDRHGEARQAFERALALEPENKPARRGFIIFLGQDASRAYSKGQLDRAIALCQRQLELEPGYAPATVQLASLYFDTGRKKEAKALLKQMLASDPNDPKKRVAVGGIYLENDLKKEAAAEFKKAIEIEPSTVCLLNVGLAYWNNDNERTAKKYFDQAIAKAGKEDAQHLIGMAIELVEEEDSPLEGLFGMGGATAMAQRFLDRAIEVDPDDPAAYLLKAVMMMSNPLMLILQPGGSREAIEAFKQAERKIEGNPKYAPVAAEFRQMREMLEKGPLGLESLLGGPPGLFDGDDDDDDFIPPFFDPPARSRKKRKR